MHGLRRDHGDSDSEISVANVSEVEEEDNFSEADSEEGYEPRFTKASFSDSIIFLPFNPVWKFLLMILISSLYCITMYELVFICTISLTLPLWMMMIKYACHVAYLIDTIAAIIHRKKKSVAALKNHRPRPLWQMAIDGFTLFPFEPIVQVTYSRADTSDLQHEIYTLMLLVGCVRVYRIYLYFRELTKSVGLNPWANVLTNFGTVIFLVTHTLTCLYFWLTDVKHGLWGPIVGLTPESNPTTWYVICLFYINTIFTATGFGDLYSVTWLEHLITLITMICGFVLITGVFCGALTDVLVQSYRGHSRFWNKLILIKVDLTYCHEPFSHVMINRVMSFYKRFWVEKGSIKDSSILLTLPNQMRGEVYVDMYWNAINGCRIFRDLDISYKRELAKYMHSECYLEGDIILNQGALKCKMLYVVQGVIQILSKEDSESPLISMSSGTCLGETSLLLSYPSVVEITAATYCELQMLDKKRLVQLIRAHPQIGRMIYQNHRSLLSLALYGIREKHSMDDHDGPETGSLTFTFPRRRALKELKMSLRHRDEVASRAEPFSWMSEKEKDELMTDEEKEALIPAFLTSEDHTMAQYSLSKSMKLETDDVCIQTHWPWVFNPNSNIISIWNWIIVMTVSVACVSIPYYVCFERKQIATVSTLFTIIDVLYWIDIYVHITTALSVNGVDVVSIFKIVLLKSQKLTYIIDFFAALPLEQVAKCIFVFNNDLKYNVFRLNRVFKVHRVLLMFQQLQNGPLWDNALVRISKYTVFLLLGSFWMGSWFYMLACIDDESCPDSWVAKLESKDKMALKSFYFAIVVISQTGFGDILPNNMNERICMVGFYVVGCMLFTYLIADFSGMLILKAMPRNEFTQRVFAISRFMEVSRVDSSIRERINNFLRLQWHYRGGFFIMSNQHLYYESPEIMQHWIQVWRRKNFFLSMDLFKGAEVKLIETLCRLSESYALPPDEIVTFAGEMVREFYIIEEGYCESRSSLVKDIGILGPHNSFNDSEMVFGIPGFRHVRTLTHCKLLRLTHRNFKSILAQFPEFKETLEKVKMEQELDERTVPSVRTLRNVTQSENLASSKKLSWIVHKSSTKQHPNADYDRPFSRLHVYAFIRHLLMRRTICPDGRFLLCWEISRSIFALMSALLFPPLAELRTVYPSLRYIAIVLDVTAYVDIYVRMHVCYYNKQKLLVSHPWYTCKHYFSQAFPLDVFACFPFEIFFGSDGSNIRASSHIVAQNFLRLNRSLQLYRIQSLASYFKYDIIKQYTYVPLLEFLPHVLALVNIFTCVYIWLHSEYSRDPLEKPFKPQPGTMLYQFYDGGDYFSFNLEHPVNYYIISCYWISGIMFSIGFGDIVPMNESEQFYAIVCILVGYLVLTYVTVRVASSYAIYNTNLTLYQENMRHLINFTKRENVTRFLKREIVEHFENVWQKTLGLKPYQMFEKFHVQLKEDAAMHLYEHTLTANPLFKDVEKSFFRRLVVLLRERYFVPGAEVITLHDFVTHVHFVHYGELNAFDLSGEKRAVLRKGNVFGNLERHHGMRLTMPIVASTNVLVLVIHTDAFFTLVDDYPIIRARLGGKGSEEIMFEKHDADLLIHSPTSRTSNAISLESTFLRNVAKVASVAYLILMMCSYLSCGLIAYHLAFESENPSLFVIVCSSCLDACLFLRFFFGFFAPYKNNMGDIIKEPHLIRANYMKDKFGFWLDVVSSFPLELLAFAAPEKDWWYTVACLRLVHLVRVCHIVKFFNISFEKLDINILLYKASHLGLWVILYGHVATCILYMLGCPRQHCYPGSWADKYNDICYENFYICAVYIIVEVMTTAGVGNIAARTQSEMAYIIVMSVVSRFAIGIFIGGMSAIVANYSYSLVNYDFETNVLKYYLKNNPVCGPLVNMVLKYVQKMWKGEHGQQTPAFLEHTPSYLMARFNTEVYGKHLYENHVFSPCDTDFLRQLIVFLKRFTFYPGNFIAQQGDMDNSLYFVHEGEVEVIMVAAYTMEMVDVLSHGDTFGLRQGLHMNHPHDYTYRASAVTVVLTLNYTHWEHLLEYFPGTRSDILSRVEAVVAAVVRD